MKKVLVCCIALLLCASVSGQMQSYSIDFELSKKKFADTIKVRFEDGRLLVPVSIDGRRYNFMLDTGASHAVVYNDAMIKGCVPIGMIPSNDAVNRKDTVEIVKLPPIQIGKITLTGCRATLQNRRLKEIKIDGVLGFDLVNKGVQMKIDARKGIMILTDRKHFFDSERGIEVKYSQKYHVPYIEVMPFCDYQDLFLFDTGSPRFLSINKKQFAENEAKMVNRKQIEGRSLGCVSIGYSGVEAMDEVVFLGLDNIKIGALSLKDVHVITTQGKSHLGASIMKYASVTFNPFRKTVCFQPYNGENSLTVSNRQMEKAIVPNKNGQPMIGLIWEKSELYNAGLRAGDIILSIDGRPLYSVTDYQMFLPIKNYVHLFTVKNRNGIINEIKVPSKYLISQ